MELTQACQPLGAKAAREMGFLDDAFGEDANSFEAELRARATRLAQDPEFRAMLRKKHESRLDDESIKPLASYRAEELERMKVNFFGPDPAYHEARRRFVFKGNPPPPAEPSANSNSGRGGVLGSLTARSRANVTRCGLDGSVPSERWRRVRSVTGPRPKIDPGRSKMGTSLPTRPPPAASPFERGQ